MVESSHLNALLIQSIDKLIQELLPDGKHTGHEYKCASCHGGKGNSFSLNVTKGIWSDFADDAKGGDLISLFIARAGGDKRKGMADVYSFLNLKQHVSQPSYAKPTKKFVRPTPDWSELDGPVYTYLTKDRKIPEDTLAMYEVMMNSSRIGDAYVFLYKSQSGNIVYLAKYCALERNEGKKRICAQAEGLQVLYGQHSIKSNQSWIVITSGEIDALSYAAQRIPAVSIPNGDSNLTWLENSWDFLTQFKTIYLSFDEDESGQKQIDTVAARLGVERCRKVSLPEKDANDCHVKGIQLRDHLKSAAEITPIGFLHSADLIDEVWLEISKGPRGRQGIPFMGWGEGEEDVGFRLRPHETTVLLGMEFSGKSTLLYQLAAYLAGVHGKKIFIASLEDNPETVLAIMMQQWLATELDVEAGLDIETFQELYQKTIASRIFVYNDRSAEASMKNLTEAAEYSIKRYGVEFVILDSLTCTDVNLESNEEANLMMKHIIKCCNQTHAHFLLVAHSRKTNHDEHERASLPKRRDIKGSVTIPALAHNIIVCWRNGLKKAILDNKRQTKHNPADVVKWSDSIFAVRKDRAGGKVGEFEMFFNEKTSRFRRIQEQRDAPYIVDKVF